MWDRGEHGFRLWLLAWWHQAITWNNVGLSSNWLIRSCGIYRSGLSQKIWRYQSVKWDWNLYVGIFHTPSPKINNLLSSDFVCHGGKQSSIVTIFNPSGLCLFKGNKVPSPCVFCDHTTGGAMSQELTCSMRSQSHERSWPPLLKLKFGNG